MKRTRFEDVAQISDLSTCLVGIGGIGFPTALTLLKQGVSHLSIFDDDYVSEENCSTQLYGPDQVGMRKVMAAYELLHSQVDDGSVDLFDELFPPFWPSRKNTWATTKRKVLITAVDKLSSRQEIYIAWRDTMKMEWFIDPRMGAENLQIYVVKRGGDNAWYESFLFRWNEEDVPELPCTAKATFYTGLMAGAAIGSIYVAISRGKEIPAALTMDLRSFQLEVLRWL